MKLFIHSLILLIIFVSISEAQNCKVKVKIRNLNGLEGQISIGLFDDPEYFPKKGEGKIGVSLAINDSIVEYIFANLKEGKYSLAIYHDENSNGELDRSVFGWPVESYVFSNYAKGSFGPPSFDDASFFLSDSVLIELEFE
jgi:uncharacterized protein (DUF2141 family)